MKLYATVTSEKATKGQGGNKYLIMEMTGEDQKVFADLRIYEDTANDQYVMIFTPPAPHNKTMRFYFTLPEKGKQQKDEMKLDPCPECGSTMVHTHQ